MSPTITDFSDIRIYGWSPVDILKVQQWLMNQGVNINNLNDLESHSIQMYHWPKQRVMQFLKEDFK